MRFVKPAIFMTGKWRPNDDEIYKWLIFVGASEEVAEKYAYKFSGKTDAERGVELFGRRCYMSFEPGLNPNVMKIREEVADYIDNVMKSKHGSVLEHCTFTFSIENVSRVFTGEMNRHRAGVAISEGSMRFILYTDIPFCETPLLRLTKDEAIEVESAIQSVPTGPAGKDETWRRQAMAEVAQTLAIKKARTRDLFKRGTEQDEANYEEFREIWKEELAPSSKFAHKKEITSLARRGIPMGVATGGVWTFNTRALRHMITMRASAAAEEEILFVACMILERMMKEEPILFGDFNGESGYWQPKYEKV